MSQKTIAKLTNRITTTDYFKLVILSVQVVSFVYICVCHFVIFIPVVLPLIKIQRILFHGIFLRMSRVYYPQYVNKGSFVCFYGCDDLKHCGTNSNNSQPIQMHTSPSFGRPKYILPFF